jgi:hypothetical protein
VKVIEKHAELPGLGIYESAAIVVHGNSFEVIGGQVRFMTAIGTTALFITPCRRANLVLERSAKYSLSPRVDEM